MTVIFFVANNSKHRGRKPPYLDFRFAFLNSFKLSYRYTLYGMELNPTEPIIFFVANNSKLVFEGHCYTWQYESFSRKIKFPRMRNNA